MSMAVPLSFKPSMGRRPDLASSKKEGQSSLTPLEMRVAQVAEDRANFLNTVGVVPGIVSVCSDVGAAVQVDPNSTSTLLSIGNLSLLTALTAPIKLILGYWVLKETEGVAEHNLAVAGLLIGGIQFVQGLLTIIKKTGQAVAAAADKTFPKVAQGMKTLTTSLSLIFYSVIALYYGYQLKNLVKFQYRFHKMKDPKQALLDLYDVTDAEKTLIMGAFVDDPAVADQLIANLRVEKREANGPELKAKMGDKAFRNLNKALAGEGEITDKLITQVKISMAFESVIRMVGITACVMGAISVIVASLFSGPAAVIAIVAFSLVGAVCWSVSDTYSLWNSMQDGQVSKKKALAMSLFIIGGVIALNLSLLFASGLGVLMINIALVTIWFGALGLLAFYYYLNYYKAEEKLIAQAATNAEKSG